MTVCCSLSSDLRPLIGAVAQLGERLLCKQEVIGSIPFSSTRAGRFRKGKAFGRARSRDVFLLSSVLRPLSSAL